MPSVLRYRILTSAAAALAILSFGCGGRTPAAKTEQPKLVSRYQNLPPLNVPSYLKDSVFISDVENLVSSEQLRLEAARTELDPDPLRG